MFGAGTRRHLAIVAITLTVFLQAWSAIAQNRMQLKKESRNSITLELMNSDSIAGFQFTLQAYGGVVWGLYEGGARLKAAGITVYQHRMNDSTLNVVLLAPYRSALPAGQGVIGRIDFRLSATSEGDTLSVALGGVVLCNASAQSLGASPTGLVWVRQREAVPHNDVVIVEQNYPNPFNPSTTIAYRLMRPATVRLEVYDATGRRISILVSEYQPAGRFEVRWRATDGLGTQLASGMYFARLQVEEQSVITKMILLR